MSEALYEKLVEKWKEFLDKQSLIPPEDEDDLEESYDYLAQDFCREQGYSNKTLEFAFHGQWYDTFADEYFQTLEHKEGWKGFPEPIIVDGEES